MHDRATAKPAAAPAAASILQRTCACGNHAPGGGECEECKKKRLQRQATGAHTPNVAPPIVHDVLRAPGQPLDAGTRAFMEPRFGHDFSRVRVHTDPAAAASARAVGALAYTVGPHIAFGTGQYAPGTPAGQRLLAHELTHVVQQSASNAEAAPMASAIAVGGVDDAYEREANSIAEAVNNNTLQADFSHLEPRASLNLQRACGPAAIGSPAGCTPVSGNIVGERFLFAINCDTFLTPAEQTRLELFADTIANGEMIEIHGFASMDGDPAFNENLSCARALKVQAIIQSILAGKGVSALVGAFMHGANPGLNPAEQRSVVIDRSGVVPPSPIPPPTPPPVPAPPSPALASCNPAQTSMVNSHAGDARTWINDAVPKIRAFASGTASPADAAIVSAALMANFHTTAPADVATIAANFDSLRTKLMSALDIECVSATWCGPHDLAYVRGAFAWIRRLGDVNLCPIWFSCRDYFTRVTTIIHEVAHQHPGATDNAYEWEAAYASLSSSDAIDNAESYAVAARQIYHAGGHGPGTGGTC